MGRRQSGSIMSLPRPSSNRRFDRGEGWGSLLRVTACFLLVSVGVVSVLPRVRGGVGGEGGDGGGGGGGSAVFADVRIPAEMVPVTIGRIMGSVPTSRIDAQVTMCSLDRNTYFHQPYKYPMFKDLVELSGGCLGRSSTSSTLSRLQADIDANPEGYLEPTGFVFHMSRCGSTLTANLMGSSPYNLVYSESRPPASIVSLCEQARCSEEQMVEALRTTIRAMGKTSFHKHMFFKFQSSQTPLIHYYRKAFPNTPWIFVYRDPVPVMMSLMGFNHGQLLAPSPSTPCLRSKRSPPEETARLLGMTQNEARNAPNEQYCAAHLATLVESALTSIDAAAAAGSGAEAGGHAVDYDTLPNAIVPVMSDLFHAPLTPEAEYYAREISGRYAKSRGQVYNFSPDTKAKEDHASPKIEEAAASILQPFYPRLHEAGVPADSIPDGLALGFTPHGRRSADAEEVPSIVVISDEAFYATPEHLRGLDRVVDPLAPSFMASSAFKSMPIEPFECPDIPPADYPKGYPAMDVINHWNPDDADEVPPFHHLSTCRFDYQRELEKAERYSAAEKPFILYNIPSVDAAAGRWSDPAYMEKIFGSNTKYATEHSTDNHFMYFNHKLGRQAHKGDQELNLTDWKPPTDSVDLSYREWLELALKYGKGDGEHWYFRVGDANNKVILREMEIFQKPAGGRGNIFLVDPKGQRGIHCRFGMPGVIAEAHFDGSRNMVAMISGVRRWIMAHPNQCETMYLLPSGHPSGRHSDVDWSKPDLKKFPNFPKTLVSEVLLKAGEVLYVPTQWFHYISNIGINAQCNSRSGIAMDYNDDLAKCGFGSSRTSSRKRKSKPRRQPEYHRFLLDEQDEP